MLTTDEGLAASDSHQKQQVSFSYQYTNLGLSWQLNTGAVTQIAAATWTNIWLSTQVFKVHTAREHFFGSKRSGFGASAGEFSRSEKTIGAAPASWQEREKKEKKRSGAIW